MTAAAVPELDTAIAVAVAHRGPAPVWFWLIAPYVGAESLRNLFGEHRAETTAIGIVLTAIAVFVMPLLGYAKHRLGKRLGSAATTGEGTQNYLCAAQAAAVLIGWRSPPRGPAWVCRWGR